MKKVLILIPRMGSGGAERVVSIIANSLSERYSVQITTLVSNESFYELKDAVKLTSAQYKINRANKITRLGSMGKNFISSVFFTRSTIQEYKPDIIFSLLAEMDIVTYLATRNLHGFEWVCSERNDPTKRNRRLQRILEKIYTRCDVLVCQSQAVADYYSMIANKTVIPNPVDFSNYPARAREGIPAKIVTVGRLVPQKNIELLVKAFSLIEKKFPETTVIVYGEGPERGKLEKQIADYGLEDRFVLPGASKGVLKSIRDAAIFAFPTNYEGFPNALVEAIAMGIPVVSTDFATGVAKEIVDEEVGLVVPCGDIKAFAGALDVLLSNPEKRAHIRNVSRKAVESFAVEKVIMKWNCLFELLMEDKKCQNL